MTLSNISHGIAIKALSGIVLLAVAVTTSCTAAHANTAGVEGVTAGTGSLLVYGTTTKFIPRGFTSIGVLYPAQYASTMCTSLSTTTQQDLAAAETTMTGDPYTQVNAMHIDWYANTVRFQLSQGALTYEHENGLSAYTNMVLAVISEARTEKLVVVVSLQTEAFSCTPTRSNGQLQKLPDQLTEEAWAQIVPTLSGDRGVILEVFNEPNTDTECGAFSWTDWATGCGTGSDEGMNTVGSYLRGLAPDNVLLFDGDNDAGKFSGFTPPSGMPANSAYTVHPYYYVDGSSGWDTRFGDLWSSGYTILASEWNESSNCAYAQDPNQTIAGQLVQTYLPGKDIGVLLFSWDAPTSGSGYLVNSSTYAPVDSNPGCSYFTGATLMLNEFKLESGD
jgi:hypothetical protein